MAVLKDYMAGEKVIFKSHQGQNNDFEADYDSLECEKERSPIKAEFDKTAILLDAAANVDALAVSSLLESGVDPNVTNADGLTALHQACIEGSLKVASLLIQNEADINKTDNDWWTPLHAASACDQWRIVNLLLSKEADITAVNADGDLAIDVCEDEKTRKVLEAEMGRQDLMGEAREKLVDVPEEEFTEALKEIIEKEDHKEFKGPHQETLLHIAASNGWTEATKMLIDAGVMVSSIDEQQDTPLHLAAFFGHYEIVEMLGEAGGKVSALNRYRDNVLMMTEDQTMTRLLKAIQNNQKVAAEAKNGIGMRKKRLGSSVKRKSMSEKSMLLMQDMLAEKKTASEFAKHESRIRSLSPTHTHAQRGIGIVDEDGLPMKGTSFAVPTPSPLSPEKKGKDDTVAEDSSTTASLEQLDFTGKTSIKPVKEKGGGCCVLQ